MAITIDLKGIEYTLATAVGHTPIAPNQMGGRVRMAYFTYTTPATTGVTDGQNIGMCVIPKGARVLGGKIIGEAMAGSAAVDIGLAGNDGSGYIDAAGSVEDDDDLFLAAGDVSSAFALTFADTIARNYGYETEKEVILVATAETDDWAAEKDVYGHVEYVVD